MRPSPAARIRSEDDEQEASVPLAVPEEVLKKHGLKLSGFDLCPGGRGRRPREGGGDPRLENDLKIALKQRQATVSPEARQQTINNLVDEIDQCRIQMRNAGEMMNRIPKWRGQFHNPDDAAQILRAPRRSRPDSGVYGYSIRVSQAAQKRAIRPRGESKGRRDGQGVPGFV